MCSKKMRVSCCTPICAKWATLTLSLVCLILGILLAAVWGKLFKKIVNHQFSVSNQNTKGYEMWKETPIPMYLHIYMFNWTNALLYNNNFDIKPIFNEIGPYVFYEHHTKENVTFNDNHTLTYLNKRTWRFEPDMSRGSLNDLVTTLNPVAAVVANVVKDEHYLVKRAVNMFFKEKGEQIYVQKQVRELLFEGYDDPLIDIALKLNMSSFKLPFKKFGWFVDRNNSLTYDGVYNMYDGGDDIAKLGLITRWNYEHVTSYYPEKCAIVNGSSGELWYPPRNDEEVSIFSPDMCSNVAFRRNGSRTFQGIEGNFYVGSVDTFDNGTFFKSTKCFASGLPTGVRSVSTCKYDAPAYMSFPHFYLADPIYRDDVDGMNPNPQVHQPTLTLEPSTGLPLTVSAGFQLNLLIRNINGIDMFSKTKTTLIPCLWFLQKADLNSDLASQVKLVLIANKLGTYTGYGLIGLGALFGFIFFVLIYKAGWQSNEEEHLMPENDDNS
ncbi:protein croquemort isoform X2 [Euwallacea fornicatus]|uniref:protein croquemort isoform X2 n=1 Tax=Euwallacea fornicatus TaxID=995702 RepID=UPI00339002DF